MAAASLCFLAVLCSLLHQGLSITCYQCNSHNDSRCLLDKLPDSLRQPCPSAKDTMCRKISQVVEFEMNGMPPDSRVIRGCGWDESNYKALVPPPASKRVKLGEYNCIVDLERSIDHTVPGQPAMNCYSPNFTRLLAGGWTSTLSTQGRCYQRSGFGGRQEVCSCLEDGCNSASAPVAATLLMLLTFAILRF